MRSTLAALASMAPAARCAVRGVLTDIDDTLTTSGKLTGSAYMAMERLRDGGLMVIPVTGRPAGWCDHIARMWPVDAVVGENGALWMRYDARRGKLERRFAIDEPTRTVQKVRLQEIGERILNEVPGTAFASDQHYREMDIAIDYCEDVTPLSKDAIDRIVRLMQNEGMTAKVSSIHVNGWFGHYDKLAMTRLLLTEVFGIDLDRERERYVFIGDSPNDAPMFEFFPLSVGVANVRDFAERMPAVPAFVTEATSGAGFVELAEFLLEEP